MLSVAFCHTQVDTFKLPCTNCQEFSLWSSLDIPGSCLAINSANKGQIVGNMVFNVTRL